MAIVAKERHGVGYDCKILVEQSGMDLTVKAGVFTINGVEHELAADELFTATADGASRTSVVGYLVEEVASGDVDLLVDETLMNGEDTGYAFERGGPYKAIHRLFAMIVPAGVTTLDGVDVAVSYITGPVEAPAVDAPVAANRKPEPKPAPAARSVS